MPQRSGMRTQKDKRGVYAQRCSATRFSSPPSFAAFDCPARTARHAMATWMRERRCAVRDSNGCSFCYSFMKTFFQAQERSRRNHCLIRPSRIAMLAVWQARDVTRRAVGHRASPHARRMRESQAGSATRTAAQRKSTRLMRCLRSALLRFRSDDFRPERYAGLLMTYADALTLPFFFISPRDMPQTLIFSDASR
jgi:hypothetical protein